MGAEDARCFASAIDIADTKYYLHPIRGTENNAIHHARLVHDKMIK